jgi:elongation factor Ts
MTATITAKDVAALREKTGAGMMDCKKALEETAGNADKAVELLRSKGAAKAEKSAGRQTMEGVIANYVHHNGKIAVLVELNCETDFVARTEDFQQLGKYLAEHIAAPTRSPSTRSRSREKIDSERRIFTEQVKAEGKPDHLIDDRRGKVQAFYKDVALLHQAWVRETAKTVGDLVKEVSAKTGENVKVRRFVRYQLEFELRSTRRRKRG